MKRSQYKRPSQCGYRVGRLKRELEYPCRTAAVAASRSFGEQEEVGYARVKLSCDKRSKRSINFVFPSFLTR